MSAIETKPAGYRVVSLDKETPKQSKESDAQIIERLRGRFEILEDMTSAVRKGQVRAMIVSGAPGVGKSFGVEKVLSRTDTFAAIAGSDSGKFKKYEIIKGAMSAIGLYTKLYEYSDEKSILVFDDCDSILLDDVSLNILKAALDTSKKRTISWNTDSRTLRNEGVPNSFEFKGGCIFITNLNFANIKSKKLQDHLQALESRCHYIDLTIHSAREKMLRIRQILNDGMLDGYDFTQEENDAVIEYIDTNKQNLRELSLRTVIKLADLVKSFPNNKWRRVADVSLMR